MRLAAAVFFLGESAPVVVNIDRDGRRVFLRTTALPGFKEASKLRRQNWTSLPLPSSSPPPPAKHPNLDLLVSPRHIVDACILPAPPCRSLADLRDIITTHSQPALSHRIASQHIAIVLTSPHNVGRLIDCAPLAPAQHDSPHQDANLHQCLRPTPAGKALQHPLDLWHRATPHRRRDRRQGVCLRRPRSRERDGRVQHKAKECAAWRNVQDGGAARVYVYGRGGEGGRDQGCESLFRQ